MADQSYYESLMAGPEEAAAFAAGDTSKCTVTVREVPDPVPVYKAEDVARMRKALNLSRRRLAYALGVSPRTVEAWEAGKNEPSGAARHLLYLFETDNSLVDRLVAW